MRKIQIDNNLKVMFDFDHASLATVTSELNRINETIAQFEKYSSGEVVPIIEEDQSNNRYTVLSFNNETLTKKDIDRIKDFIEIMIRASSTNRIMELKLGILEAKTRLKQII